MKCHHVKYHKVQAIEKSIIRGITNGIRANLFPSMMWFEDELGRSKWVCNTPMNHAKKRQIQRLCRYVTEKLKMA